MKIVLASPDARWYNGRQEEGEHMKDLVMILNVTVTTGCWWVYETGWHFMCMS